MTKWVVLCLVVLMTGCASIPQDAFTIGETQLQRRSLETRNFEGIDEESLLSACSNVLQDMGFQLEDSEVALGVLTAQKDRDATDTGEVVLAVFVALLGGQPQAMDKDQRIRVSIVTRPLYSGAEKRPKAFGVRATFHRVVTRTDGTKRAETLGDAELYEGFFAQLSKSVFIEGQKI